MVSETVTSSQSYYGVSQYNWLPTRQGDAPRGIVSRSATNGWNDAYVAAFLFNVQCNDSYVAAFLMNLRA